MISFIHTADIHFGMENYGRIDPVTGIHTRLLDFHRALSHCIDYAIEHSVDFFMFSGDAYKTAHPSPTHQRLLMECFLRLFKAQIPLVIVIGNHDNPLSFGKAHALEIFGQLPVEGFHVIAQPTSFVLATKSGPIQIVGIPWPSRTTIALTQAHADSNSAELAEYISGTVSSIIKQFAQKLDTAIPAILAGHLTVSSGIFSGSEKRALCGTDPLFLPSQLAIEPFDYVALGHLHRYQNLNEGGYPAVVYSGSVERIDFGERKEEKGFCVVRISAKGKTEHTFIPIPARPFIQVDVRLHDQKSQTEQIIAAIRPHSLENAVIKIVYYLLESQKDQVDIAAIQNACADAHYLVGIFPVRPVPAREQRALVTVDMTMENLLDMYCQTKPSLHTQKKALIEKASLLMQELADQQTL